MINLQTTVEIQRLAGRWIVFIGRDFSIDENTRTITLDRTDLESSIDAMVAWSNVPPKKHGRFYIEQPKRRWSRINSLFERLDDRWVLCSS